MKVINPNWKLITCLMILLSTTAFVPNPAVSSQSISEAEGFYQLGVKALEDNTAQLPQAIKWFETAAEQGHPAAQNALGLLHYNNAIPTASAETALDWFRKAAEQGHPEAQYQLGMICTVEDQLKNITVAAKWFQKAAEQGHPAAQYQLGMLYMEHCNYEMANKWLRTATTNKDINATMLLRLDRITLPEKCLN